MRIGRSFASLLLLAIVALPVRPALAQSDPGAFITGVGDRVVKLISDKQAPEAQRKQEFTQLVEQSFDVPAIARFVLGRYWRTATDAEKASFQKAFETYMIAVYWSRFTSYNGESFKVAGTEPQGNDVTVRTQILRPNSNEQPVEVTWFLAKTSGGYRIEDASLEGVSQAVTYRDEFASIIEQNGGQVSALIDKLNARAKG